MLWSSTGGVLKEQQHSLALGLHCLHVGWCSRRRSRACRVAIAAIRGSFMTSFFRHAEGNDREDCDHRVCGRGASRSRHCTGMCRSGPQRNGLLNCALLRSLVLFVTCCGSAVTLRDRFCLMCFLMYLSFLLSMHMSCKKGDSPCNSPAEQDKSDLECHA